MISLYRPRAPLRADSRSTPVLSTFTFMPTALRNFVRLSSGSSSANLGGCLGVILGGLGGLELPRRGVCS